MWPLILASTLALAGAGAYAAIGLRYAQLARKAPVQRYFALFWLGVSLYSFLDGAWSLAVPLWEPPLSVGLVVLHLKILAGTAAFFGLVYYLVFLYTGRRQWLWPLVGFYTFVLAFTLYSYASRDPIGQQAMTWGSGLTYANPGGAVTQVAYVLLFLPPLVAALAYGALMRHAASTQQRLRILATSGALTLFFAGILLNWVTNFVPSWPLLEKVFALVAAIIVYATHTMTDQTTRARRPAVLVENTVDAGTDAAEPQRR